MNGVDITSQITSGKIGALITLRDQTLPAAQSQLDELAQQLNSSLNAVSNQGTSVPPPTSLTGTATVSSTTIVARATGTVRIAVADKSGNLVSYQDLDLSAYSTVGASRQRDQRHLRRIGIGRCQRPSVDRGDRYSGDGIAINDMTSSVGRGRDSPVFRAQRSRHRDRRIQLRRAQRHLRAASPALPTATLDCIRHADGGKSVLSSGSATIVNALVQAR